MAMLETVLAWACLFQFAEKLIAGKEMEGVSYLIACGLFACASQVRNAWKGGKTLR